MASILVVEDDPAVRDIVKITLEEEGMEVEAVENGRVALQRLRSSHLFDLAILDVMLPEVDGITLCQELRASGNAIPVVILTARDDETSVVVGLEVGADDYVTKPFSPRELVSRVRAHLRRRRLDAQASEQKLEFSGLMIDVLRREALIQGNSIPLTNTEFEILRLLTSHPGRVYSRQHIMSYLWDRENFRGELRPLDTHIMNLRKKIEINPKDPRFIQTVRGVGYKFTDG